MSGRLVTRAEAAEILGYGYRSLVTLMLRYPDRWPAPAGTQRTPSGQKAYVYDLDAMRAAANRADDDSPLRNAASMSDDDGLITCLECGRRLRFLAAHLVKVHGTTADEYRSTHKLPATAAMHADVTRRRMRTTRREMLAADPSSLDHLAEYHTPEHLAAMTEAGRENVRESHRNEIVTARRAPGRAKAVEAMNAARRRALDERVQARGYADVADAVERTLHMSVREASSATSLSVSMLRRWRQRYPQ